MQIVRDDATDFGFITVITLYFIELRTYTTADSFEKAKFRFNAVHEMSLAKLAQSSITIIQCFDVITPKSCSK